MEHSTTVSEVTALSEGDNVKLQGNGMDKTGTVEDVEDAILDHQSGKVAFVRTSETVLTVHKPEPHPLQTDSGLMNVGGHGKVRVTKA